jgi:negative regulator of sigma E activity
MKIQLKIALLAAGISVATFGLDAARKLETPVYTYTPVSTSDTTSPKVTEAEVEKVIDQVMTQAQQGTATGEKLPWWQRAKAHITRNWEKYVTGGVAATAIVTLATLVATERNSKNTAEARVNSLTSAMAESLATDPTDPQEIRILRNSINKMNKDQVTDFLSSIPKK